MNFQPDRTHDWSAAVGWSAERPIAVQSLFGRCSVAVRSLFGRCSVAIQSLFGRCSIAVQSLFGQPLTVLRRRRRAAPSSVTTGPVGLELPCPAVSGVDSVDSTVIRMDFFLVTLSDMESPHPVSGHLARLFLYRAFDCTIINVDSIDSALPGQDWWPGFVGEATGEALGADGMILIVLDAARALGHQSGLGRSWRDVVQPAREPTDERHL